MVAKGRRKTNLMAPYFVQLREFERRLMRDAIEAVGGPTKAAAILGVTPQYLFARAKHLGGVIGDEPKHEPPEPTKQAWTAGAKAARHAAVGEMNADTHQLDASDGPRCACGNPSSHESGACAECIERYEVYRGQL